MRTRIERISDTTFEGYHQCLDAVARERKYLAFTQAPPLEESRTQIQANIKKRIPQYVALVHERVVGWIDIAPREYDGMTHVGELGMGILRDFRGRGLGKQLMETALQDAREQGLERIELYVYASNAAAVALYEKYGFRQEGVQKQARFLDGVYDDVIMMAKLFGSAQSHQSITIAPITEQDRAWTHAYLCTHWGVPQIVSCGTVHQADKLPGFMALLNGSPVGLVTYHIANNTCEVISLNADIARMGIGSALLEAVRKHAVAQDCTRLFLLTTNDNTGALCFYQKCGYEIANVYRHAVEESRKLKPSIPTIGLHGIPIRDEIELEHTVQGEKHV